MVSLKRMTERLRRLCNDGINVDKVLQIKLISFIPRAQITWKNGSANFLSLSVFHECYSQRSHYDQIVKNVC